MPLETRASQLFSTFELTAPSHWKPESFELSPAVLAQNLVIGFDPQDDRAQAFYGMRSQLLRHIEESGRRIFAMTSVEPGNGKTHVAVNLAATLSRIRPTVLIELDMHRPSLGRRLGLPADARGIDDYLDGRCAWHQAEMHIGGYDLNVYRVRHPRERAEQLLNSPRLAEFFDHLRAHRDPPICIVDTPPALVGDDLMLISRVIDGIVMVVQEARTSKRALRDTLKVLGQTPIVGSVLNMSIASAPAATDYGYYRQRDA